MPHIILEYNSEDVTRDDLSVLLERVYSSVAGSGLFEAGNIKLRAMPVHQYRPDPDSKSFIHVQCRIHQGRSNQQRHSLSGGIVDALRELNTGVSVITCEVIEMDRQSYAKWSL